MVYVPFIALLMAALCAWVPRWLPGAVVLLGLGYAWASVTDQLAWPAIVAVVALSVASLGLGVG